MAQEGRHLLTEPQGSRAWQQSAILGRVIVRMPQGLRTIHHSTRRRGKEQSITANGSASANSTSNTNNAWNVNFNNGNVNNNNKTNTNNRARCVRSIQYVRKPAAPPDIFNGKCV